MFKALNNSSSSISQPVTSTGGSNENKGEFGDADEDMEDTEASEMNDRMKKVRDIVYFVYTF